jgi:hypothetical protein
MRYCVHCGADVADLDDARPAGSGSAGGAWVQESGTAGGPWAQESGTTGGPWAQGSGSGWSTGEFRAPSPLDGVPLLPPLAPSELLAEAPSEPWSPDAWYAEADPPPRVASGPAAAGAAPDPAAFGAAPVADPAAPLPWPSAPLPSPAVPPVDGAWWSEQGWPAAAPLDAVSPDLPGPGGAPGGPVFASVPFPSVLAARPSRRTPLLLIVGAVVVLAMVSAAGLLWLNRRGGDPVTAADGAPVPAASFPASVSSAGALAPPPAGATASSPATGSGDGDATTGMGADVQPPTAAMSGSASTDVFGSLDALLERSAAARGDVASTAIALQSCRGSAAAAVATFRRARDDRNQLASEASALSGSVGADQQVGDAVRAFIALQQSSAHADDAFAAWASEVATAGCSGQARHTANWDLASRYSGDATAAKARFVTLWNRIAVTHGLSERSADAI